MDCASSAGKDISLADTADKKPRIQTPEIETCSCLIIRIKVSVNLLDALPNDGVNLQVHVYDPMRWTGAGPNYNPDQSDVCILNIPARSVDYAPPEFMTSCIKLFLEWPGGRYQSEDYPARSDIGRYLHYRFKTLKAEVRDRIAIEQSHLMITGIHQDNRAWWLFSDDRKLGPYDEVLLSQGQPATSSDPQMAKWEDHTAKHDLSLLPAYPVNALLDAAEGWSDKTVAKPATEALDKQYVRPFED